MLKEDPNRKKVDQMMDEVRAEDHVKVVKNMDDSDEEDEPAQATKAPETKPSADSNLRNYEISITFDRYHQCPRLWLSGTNSKGQPLSNEEIFQDVMSDYANKTVTIEDHPHLGMSRPASPQSKPASTPASTQRSSTGSSPKLRKTASTSPRTRSSTSS